MGQETAPRTARQHGRQLLDECLRFSLKVLDLGHIHDIVHVLFGNTLVIVKLSFVTGLVQALHVQMDAEVS